MTKRRLELQELQENLLPLRQSVTNEPPSKLSKYETQQKHSDKKITIAMNWKDAQKILGSVDLVSVSRNGNNYAHPTLLFNANSFKRVWNKNWITINTGEQVFEEEFTEGPKLYISRDRLHVTIFSDSVETLLKDIEANLERLQTKAVPQLLGCSTPPENVNLHLMHPEIPINEDRIITQELLLNKDQVTYLIGKNGMRIERIRQASKATIKILPINKRLNTRELNHPDIVTQSIFITGEWYQSALAFAYIEADLQLYKLGPRRLLL